MTLAVAEALNPNKSTFQSKNLLKKICGERLTNHLNITWPDDPNTSFLEAINYKFYKLLVFLTFMGRGLCHVNKYRYMVDSGRQN